MMSSRLRPNRSDIRPNTRAPTISPTRYTDAIRPTSFEVMPSVSGLISTPVTELAMVICNPSRIQAAPSPATIRVWNGVQRRRSSLAGMVDRMGSAAATVMAAPSVRSSPEACARACPYGFPVRMTKESQHVPGASAESLQQVVPDPKRVRHCGQCRVDRADAREEARVDYIEV